jgi:hypothetical protein
MAIVSSLSVVIATAEFALMPPFCRATPAVFIPTAIGMRFLRHQLRREDRTLAHRLDEFRPAIPRSGLVATRAGLRFTAPIRIISLPDPTQ